MLTLREIAEILGPYEVILSDVQLEQVRVFTGLLLKWNRRVNLTRIVDEPGIYRHHFGESLYLTRFLPPRCERILDVGAGCGFPGLAMKLVLSKTTVTLLEASIKKALFLKEVIVTLGLESGCKIKNDRLELFCTKDPGRFDAVTTRGVHISGAALHDIATQLVTSGKLVISTSKTVAARIKSLRGEFGWEREQPLPESMNRVALLGTRCST